MHRPDIDAQPIAERTELTATAFHEAGHAIVAVYFGIPPTSVSIVPAADGSAGRMCHPSPLIFEAESRRDRRSLVRQMILVSYAGIGAQRLVEPEAPEWQAENDFANAFELSREHAVLPRGCSWVGDEAHGAYLDRLRRESARLVRRLAVPISFFAEALLVAHEMSGADASALATSLLPAPDRRAA
ncbi:MAG TPA: hypothetical protein VGP64_04080 [Polyangia bacterium]|jgi:hypothetical protein